MKTKGRIGSTPYNIQKSEIRWSGMHKILKFVQRAVPSVAANGSALFILQQTHQDL